MKNKLNLNALKVKGFVTTIEGQSKLQGGVPALSEINECDQISGDCQQSDFVCPHLTLNTCDATPGGTRPFTGYECGTKQQE